MGTGRVSVVQILREGKQLVYRAHSPVQLAVNAQGVNVRPLDPSAVAWSSTGALGRVAPARSRDDENVWFDLTTDGATAWDLLCEAARLQGYRSDDLAPIADVDRDGIAAVLRAFAKAMQLAPEEPRHKPAATGSQPRGVTA